MNKTPPTGGFFISDNGAKNMKTPLTYGAHRKLSHRVSDVESALASLNSQIMVLQTKHASPV
ncbi:hypothetical protein P1I70_005203 [Klebsiella pneumoniae]|uniref:hypothetical protein n=1 Tax=Klebsiella TaxID=570 RepID=UPI0015D5347D|nr:MULTISPECIES: hypothetical protein [Klebsiella]ELA0728101.1 hypothetical protein [Klebsiella pneumoniae]MBU8953536.1 hypothetical protein [Klebsiella quasipneumoniae]MBY0594192.1 hypothetical protein [Klebsiella sp. TFW1]MBY0605015.1 hypothetical protein [Klebsiella sp. TF21-TM]HBT6200881.1 hypothetical protein [Klebsiella pneumoniae]